MSVIVYGPAACGKTRNAEALKQAAGCKSVIDGFWQPKYRPAEYWDDAGHCHSRIPASTLILTNMDSKQAAACACKMGIERVLSFADAMRLEQEPGK